MNISEVQTRNSELAAQLDKASWQLKDRELEAKRLAQDLIKLQEVLNT